jgi:3-oxoacyl-[acyl-carrier-protein] synthase-3
MGKSAFNHVRISGLTAVVPEHVIHIDDEISFFKNDLKLLERNKKILGLGTRHVVDQKTTNADLCEAAANDLIALMHIDKTTIDALIVVSSSHDYSYPASACILQGRLGLSEECASFDISGLACSAYVHGLWLAHSLISSGAAKKCLLLTGDIVSQHSDKRNRNSNMLFGDAGTATLIEYTAEDKPSYFYLGTRGKDWDKIIAPAGGYALPIRKDIIDIEETDAAGNVWHLWDEIMKGMDVFKFTMEVGPKGIAEILAYSGKHIDEVDYFAFHQANKQIVNTIAAHAKVPKGKYSTDTFTQFGNCGSAAVTMDLCRELHQNAHQQVVLGTFGVGLSWGFAALDLTDIQVGGIRQYVTPADKLSRDAQIQQWISYFKGHQNA